MLARLPSRQALPLFVVVLVTLLLALGGHAHACAICLSGTNITPGQKMDLADAAVLALPLANGERFRVIEVIKGAVAANDIITQPGLSAGKGELVMSLDGPLPGGKVSPTSNGKPLLLIRNSVSDQWTSIGAIGANYAGWLREVVATYRAGKTRPTRKWPPVASMGSYLSNAEWEERLVVVAPYLEDPETLVAEIAYGELARAPYRAIRTLKPRLDLAKIATWLNDPRKISRHPAYTLLMGIAGGADEAAELEQRIGTALGAQDAANLSAMLAADLELRGPSRIEWLEQTYFADRRRTLPEIEAALLALSVHGGADTKVSRQRVIAAYRYFIRVRKPMAGFVAMELADWGAWEVTADYVDVFRSRAVKDPAGEFAILSFLKQSPATARLAASQLPTNQPE